MPERKLYPLNHSPLYRLRNKRKLASLLGISDSDFHRLSTDDNYSEWLKRTQGKKPRLIQEPVGDLEKVHLKLQILLSRIETPRYLFSGKRKISIIDNAKHHSGNNYFLKLDIEKFFSNCRIEYIFRFFHYQMMMSEDTAWTLARIVSCKDFVPTGSHLSQSIAYWSYSRTFDNINSLAERNQMRFSLWVDDMIFSSRNPIPRNFHLSVNYHLKRVGLHLKKKKIRYNSKNYFKVVTGCAISPKGELKAPNHLRHKILDDLSVEKDITALSNRKVRSLFTRIASARRVESGIFNQEYETLRLLNEKLPRVNRKKKTSHLSSKGPSVTTVSKMPQ